jgi:hypothetical protein
MGARAEVYGDLRSSRPSPAWLPWLLLGLGLEERDGAVRDRSRLTALSLTVLCAPATILTVVWATITVFDFFFFALEMGLLGRRRRHRELERQLTGAARRADTLELDRVKACQTPQ